MLSLSKPYLRVSDGLSLSYGGSQMRSESKTIRRCGCGPVAALDLCRYLQEQSGDEPIPLSEYNRELSRICSRYFLLIPPFGINGLLLIAGLNLLLAEKKLPYTAIWAVSGSKLWARVEAMLRQDIPVILSVGPNFPLFWQKNLLRFYVRRADGSMVPATATKAHYVTATGIDEKWVRISSWGREYYINREEYESYTRAHSSYLFSNLVLLRKKRA